MAFIGGMYFFIMGILYHSKIVSSLSVLQEGVENTINYYRSAVSHALTDMVRERTLTRIGTMRNYRYIQTRPSEAGTFQSETNYLNSG